MKINDRGLIVGKIDNLEAKLNGELPVDRLELIYLVNSLGRTHLFTINGNIEDKIRIDKCAASECYDLSKLEVSQIIDMSSIFKCSNFNGDISNWDTSKVTDMAGMFCYTKIFNKDISCWDTSNVTSMSCMFCEAEKFNQNISFWNLDNIKNSYFMFDKAKAFLDKYNGGESLPNKTDDIKEWLIKNREKMSDIDIKNIHGEEIDDFFNDIYSTNRNILHNNIHSLNKV